MTVNITGDFTELQTAVDQSVTVAQEGSEQIANSFQAIADASGLAGGDLALFQSVLEQDAAAGIELSQSLSDLADSAKTVGDAVAGAAASALEQLETAAAGAGDAAGGAVPPIEDLGNALDHANAAAEEGDGAFESFGESLLELSGIALTVEGLKELGTEVLETYGNVEKATIALTALTGSAGQATETIEGLKTIALSDALSFPSLIQADQRMTRSESRPR